MTEQERFDRCLTCILQFEGGFVDDPKDPGGATKFGVTRGTLGQWLGRPATVQDVEGLDTDTAGRIYRVQYWHVVGCDQLPAGLDLIVFDAAVQHGTAIAGRFLQQACGLSGSSIDGIVGPRTIATAKAKPALELIRSVSAYRRELYTGNHNFDHFGKGWLRRLDLVTSAAVNDATPVPNYGADVTSKALEG